MLLPARTPALPLRVRVSPIDARPMLDRAVETYERLDAARDLARIESVLRTAGIRRGRRGARGRPQHGWASLTSTEQNVAHLVAEGLSNPQIGDRLFVSRRTVQTHLAHVFAKLAISSRAQLAAEVIRQRGIGPAPSQGPLSSRSTISQLADFSGVRLQDDEIARRRTGPAGVRGSRPSGVGRRGALALTGPRPTPRIRQPPSGGSGTTAPVRCSGRARTPAGRRAGPA